MVLRCEGKPESCRLEALLGDLFGVSLINGTRENGFSEHIGNRFFIDAVLLRQRERFGERFDGRRDQKIPAELQDIVTLDTLTEIKNALADRRVNWFSPFLRGPCSGDAHPKLRRRGCFRPAKN